MVTGHALERLEPDRHDGFTAVCSCGRFAAFSPTAEDAKDGWEWHRKGAPTLETDRHQHVTVHEVLAEPAR